MLGGIEFPAFVVVPLPAQEGSGLLGLSPDAWVAFFTFALFVATSFQGWLVLRAEKLTRAALAVSAAQAKTARNAAIAALAVELPYLSAVPLETLFLVGAPAAKAQAWGGQLYEGPVRSHLAWANFSLRNNGKTAARILKIQCGFHVGSDLPQRPDYSREELNPFGDKALRIGTSMPFDAEPPFFISEEQIKDAGAGDLKLWTFCRFTYTDVQDREHIRSVIWQWRPWDGNVHRFLTDDDVPDAYKYRSDDYSDF
jgi:hypothetical protein